MFRRKIEVDELVPSKVTVLCLQCVSRKIVVFSLDSVIGMQTIISNKKYISYLWSGGATE